jgi:hypothetical protein
MNRDTASFDQPVSWLWDFCRKQKKDVSFSPMERLFLPISAAWIPCVDFCDRSWSFSRVRRSRRQHDPEASGRRL